MLKHAKSSKEPLVSNFLSFLNKGHLKLFFFSLDKPSRNILKN